MLSWWEQGYWITYIAGRSPISNPGQSIEAVELAAGILLATNGVLEAARLANKKHIILDEYTLLYKFAVMERWAGKESDRGSTFAYRLYYGEVEGFRLVHQSGDVKIWRVE